MKLQYCSDLHLEFDLNNRLLKKRPLQVKGDVLVLAGDIVPFTLIEKHQDFFDFIADNFQQVYWVPGNHEYYHSDIVHRSGAICEQIRKNVLLINNTSAIHGNTKLIFSTLWSNIDPLNEWEILRSMSDFHQIKYQGGRYTISCYNELHTQSLAFLHKELEADTAYNKVVVTHHIPTFIHYPPEYKDSVISQAFATELGDSIAKWNINSWIYGHHHRNIPCFKIANTNMLTNQLGYVKHGEHRDFDNAKYIECY